MAEMESYASPHTGEEIDAAISYIEGYRNKIDNLINYLYTGTFPEGDSPTKKEIEIDQIINYLTEIEESETKNKQDKIDEMINYLTEIKEKEKESKKEKIDGVIDYLTKVETGETKNKKEKIDDIINYLTSEKQRDIDNIIDKKIIDIEIKTYTITIPKASWIGDNTRTIKWCYLGDDNITIKENNSNVEKENVIIESNFINCYVTYSGLAQILYISPFDGTNSNKTNFMIIYGIPSSGSSDDTLRVKVVNKKIPLL